MCLCFWVLLAMFLAMLISLFVACFFKLLLTSLQYKVSFLRTVLPDHSTGVIKGTLSKDSRIWNANFQTMFLTMSSTREYYLHVWIFWSQLLSLKRVNWEFHYLTIPLVSLKGPSPKTVAFGVQNLRKRSEPRSLVQFSTLSTIREPTTQKLE